MKLDELENLKELTRPEGNKRTINDGTYDGTMELAELVERESKFSDDGTRVVLNTKTVVENSDGEMVELYYSVNYSWSTRGHMLKFLDKLDALPKPGESLRLEDLVGTQVRVTVENVEKNGETYSNIIAIRKLNEGNCQAKSRLKPLKAMKKIDEEERDDDLELDD